MVINCAVKVISCIENENSSNYDDDVVIYEVFLKNEFGCELKSCDCTFISNEEHIYVSAVECKNFFCGIMSYLSPARYYVAKIIFCVWSIVLLYCCSLSIFFLIVALFS